MPEQARVLRADGLAVLQDVRNHEQLGKPGAATVLADMDLELAEAAAERNVLLGRELLVAEVDDFVLVEELDDLAEHRIVDGPGQIDAENFDAERRAGSLDLEHGRLAGECGNSGLCAAEDQRVDVVRALIGV